MDESQTHRLSERNQTHKGTHCMIPITGHKAQKTDQYLPGVGVEGELDHKKYFGE